MRVLLSHAEGKLDDTYISRRKVLEISVTKFERANRPRVTTTDESGSTRLRYLSRIRARSIASCVRSTKGGKGREALTNFWRILYAHGNWAPCPISIVPFHILSPSHTPRPPFSRTGAIRRLVFLRPQIARARVRSPCTADAPPRHSTLVLPRSGGVGPPVRPVVSSRLAQSA